MSMMIDFMPCKFHGTSSAKSYWERFFKWTLVHYTDFLFCKSLTTQVVKKDSPSYLDEAANEYS